MKCSLKNNRPEPITIDQLSSGEPFHFESGGAGESNYVFITTTTPPNCNSKLCYAVRLEDGFIAAVEADRKIIQLEQCSKTEFTIKK
jgi:hypothetical protein